ncbi:hypothetical protein G3580_12415 [Nitrogeniibacter mangrovi]|uniref:Uncharacterized protein n=1 Tax=Nitrogeniibacter mangrovi TaxID=2016596 RepID=A0A6C1B3Y0_9RHOO|nr:hypothetical protein [Nitrogeniibacter mangrovi]QID18371.1 hypothetical protein G3580_12415 [Nitrogeniibacter mangrovi]
MRIKLMLMALAVALPAWAQAPEWQDAGGLSYLCGGVGQGSFAAIRAQRDSASVELLLTAGARGMYLADVTVTVTGPTLDGPVVIPREGPLCLLRVPPAAIR